MTKRSTKPAERQSTTTTPTNSDTKKGLLSHLGSDNFFWGLLLIAAGVLFLLHNLGVVQLHVGNIWQLRPVIIILIGVSMIQLKGVWNLVLNMVATVAVIALLLATLTHENGLRAGPVTHTSDDVVKIDDRGTLWQKTEKADVRVDSGAISVQLGAITEGKQIVNAQLEGSRKITENTRMQGTTQRIDLGTTGHPGFGLLQGKNRLVLDLTQRLPVDLLLDVGASSVKGDLSQIQLENLAIDAGASSIDLKLGSRVARTTVTIDTGASSLNLQLPKDIAYRVERDGGLSSGRFDGAEKVSDTRYETKNFASAEKQITIKADTGASSFTVTRY